MSSCLLNFFDNLRSDSGFGFVIFSPDSNGILINFLWGLLRAKTTITISGPGLGSNFFLNLTFKSKVDILCFLEHLAGL